MRIAHVHGGCRAAVCCVLRQCRWWKYIFRFKCHFHLHRYVCCGHQTNCRLEHRWHCGECEGWWVLCRGAYSVPFWRDRGDVNNGLVRFRDPLCLASAKPWNCGRRSVAWWHRCDEQPSSFSGRSGPCGGRYSTTIWTINRRITSIDYREWLH